MENPFDAGYYCSEELRQFGFKSIGESVQIAKDCTIIGLEHISIGDNVRIDGSTHMIATGGSIRLGSFLHIGAGCHIMGRGGVTMEDFSGLSQGVKLYSVSDDYSGGHLTNPTVPAEFLSCDARPIHIGRHAILGSGAVVLPGVTIGDGVALGALSLAVRDLKAWTIYSGCPARGSRARSQDLLHDERRLLGEGRTIAA